MSDEFVVAGSSVGSAAGYQFIADIPARPSTAHKFQRAHAGGGGGAGGGRGGLGGKHAPRSPQDILPRNMHGIGAQAARNVASRPSSAAARRPVAGAFNEQKPPPTLFKQLYDRGDLPLRVNGGVAKFVQWHVSGVPASTTSNKTPPNFSSAGGPEYEAARERFLAQLDLGVMLPLFFDGLREPTQPCQFLAHAGLKELLEASHAARVGPVVPQLVLPIRQALNTREPETIRRTIKAVQQLARVPGVEPGSGQTVGELLGPYYRHILPVFNLFKSKASLNSSKGDYSSGLGELMDETMVLLAAVGAPDATREINRIVPLWTPPPKENAKHALLLHGAAGRALM